MNLAAFAFAREVVTENFQMSRVVGGTNEMNQAVVFALEAVSGRKRKVKNQLSK